MKEIEPNTTMETTMENPNYYGILPASVRYDPELCPNAKVLYTEFTALCQKDGYCWATNKYFSDLYRVKQTTISEWVKQLQDREHIHVEQHGPKRKIYLREIPKLREKRKVASGNPEGKLREIPKHNINKNTINKYTLEFLQFWDTYPRKIGKQSAYKWWQAKIKNGATEADLLSAGKNYAAAIAGTESQFIKYAATFLGATDPWQEYVDGDPDKTAAVKFKPKYCANCGQAEISTSPICTVCGGELEEKNAI